MWRIPDFTVYCLVMMFLSLEGCSSDPPRPAPSVTPDQVRSHSEKAFDKLKQEEQNRPVDPANPR
jgi:hypothetical protein